MGDCVRWARAFAAALPPEITVQPAIPHTNQFFLYADGEADAINERLLAHAEQHGLALGGPPGGWWATRDRGRVMVELSIGDGALDLDPVQVAEVLSGIVVTR